MANYQDSREPSGARVAATAASETARGVGLGVIGSIAAVAGAIYAVPLILGSVGTLGLFATAALSVLTVGAAAGVLFTGPIFGAIFGAKRGIEKVDNEYARAQETQKAKTIIAAQEREMGRAEAYAEMAQPQRSAFMAQAPVYASAGECPHCKVSNMNYQGQAVGLQHGLVS